MKRFIVEVKHVCMLKTLKGEEYKERTYTQYVDFDDLDDAKWYQKKTNILGYDDTECSELSASDPYEVELVEDFFAFRHIKKHGTEILVSIGFDKQYKKYAVHETDCSETAALPYYERLYIRLEDAVQEFTHRTTDLNSH